MQHYLDVLFSISRWIRGAVRRGQCSHRLGVGRWCVPSFKALHAGGHQPRSVSPVGMNPRKLIQRTVVDQHSTWNLWECWHAGHIPCPLTEIQHFHAGTGFFTMQEDIRRKDPVGAVPVDPVLKIPWKWFSPLQVEALLKKIIFCSSFSSLSSRVVSACVSLLIWPLISVPMLNLLPLFHAALFHFVPSFAEITHTTVFPGGNNWL